MLRPLGVHLKNWLLLGMALASSLASASHTVCSAPEFYYSRTHVDSGAPPPPGTLVGTLTIAAKGRVLVKEQFFANLGHYGLRRYDVAFDGEKQVLNETGNPVAGARVYRIHAVLKQVPPFPAAELLRTPVVCEETWAMVP